ncbi:hypothetical protein HFN62_16400 [Rhizobium leguminosarum]|uniref:hypothetical protein n=1 Tax=Rhizobium leguminosarum TaxID=384 RepID=UPI0013F15E1A|nr:hypothetical protein [Rhizobium leguminosarum]MBY5785298.1 hypothetical protein [Rhizobium leguminosarum]
MALLLSTKSKSDRALFRRTLLLSDNDEISNIRQLSDFRDYWRESPSYPEENLYNIKVWYPVTVHYECADRKRNVTFETRFEAFIGSGPDDGKIDLRETRRVSVDEYHLQFLPRFQTYVHDEETHSLIITSSSKKMGGAYKVTIMPSMEKPE